MYEAFFGLNRRPFPAVPCTKHYFPASAIETARQVLSRCIERSEGVGLIVGPSGTGKTLLCALLAEEFGDRFDVVLLSSGRLGTRKALWQAILFELGQPYRGMDESELRLAVVDYVTSDERGGRGLLLLVDEAHTLPLRLLEEIRMITNLVCGGEARTRLVLSGSAALEERLASPRLESFTQRITARCYLESLNRTETEQYVQAQIDAAGGRGAEVFPAEACQAVYNATDGIPRLINQVCDHALLLACADGCRQVDKQRVEQAWADLQQLPTPWNADRVGEEAAPAVIEFGGLEDDDEELEDGEESEGARCLPMLRVAGQFDEPEEPARRLEVIEQTLADLDGQPPKEGPEHAAEPGEQMAESLEQPPAEQAEDPFEEAFDEEELIVERFGSGNAKYTAPAELDPENPWAGEAAAAAGQPHDVVAANAPPHPPWPVDDGWVGPGDRPFAQSHIAQTAVPPEIEWHTASELAPASMIQVETCFGPSIADHEKALLVEAVTAGHQPPEGPAAGNPAAEPVNEEPQEAAESHTGQPERTLPAAEVQPGEAVDWETDPPTVPLPRPASDWQPPDSPEEEDDSDLIIVEEGYEGQDGPHHILPRVRTQQYKQLFATLRRGTRD